MVLIVEFGDEHCRRNAHLVIFDGKHEFRNEVVEFYAILNKSDGFAKADSNLFSGFTLLNELVKSESLFNGVNIFALKILGDHRFKCLVIVHLSHNGGNFREVVDRLTIGISEIPFTPSVVEFAESTETALSANDFILGVEVGIAIYYGKLRLVCNGPNGDRLE